MTAGGLALLRSGDVLVAAGDRSVEIVDVRDPGRPIELAVDGVHGLLGVGDQLWLTTGSPVQLRRYGLDDGRLLGVVDGLPAAGAGSRLVRGLGAGRATWLGGLVQVALTDDDGVAMTAPIAGADLVLAMSPTRWLWCQRGRAGLREGAATRWATAVDGRVVDAAFLAEGRSAALVVERAGGLSIVVLGLHDGAVHRRINLDAVETVAFAARRNVALAVAERRRLVLLDLRFGRVLFDHRLEHDVAAVAIDEAGQQVALRHAPGGEILQIGVDALIRIAAQPSASPALAPVVAPAPPERPAPAEPAPIADDVDPFASSAVLGPCPALAPRPSWPPTGDDETHRILAAQRDRLLAWTARAIAQAWDEGRLAYANAAALPFRREVEGALGTLRGLAADDLAEAEHRVSGAEAAWSRARADARPRRPPLIALADELGLSPLERDILLVVAAPALWGEVARLYGILANDEDRPLCDEYLVATVLAARARATEVAAALDPGAPLVRLGLVRAGAGAVRPFLPLVVDRVALALLRGGRPDAELAPAIRPAGDGPGLDRLRVRGSVKARLVEDLARAAGPLRIAVRGRVGSGRRSLLAAIARSAGRTLAIIDTSAMLRDAAGRGDALRMALERAHLAGFLPCVDGLDLLASDDSAGRDQLREVLRWHPGPLALRLGWEARPPLDAGHVLVDLPVPSPSERLASWRASTTGAGLPVASVEELADRYAVGPGVIERVCAQVAGDAPAEADADADAENAELDAGARLDRAVRQHLEHRLGATAHRVQRLASWSQVILPPDIQDSLTELIARIRHRRVVFDRWGFDRVMATSRGVTALFQGGPGTGKTLVASAIANELGMDLYRVDLSRVMSKWIGETEQNLAKLFDAAEDGSAIVLFDEADSLFAKRTEVRTSVDRYANLEVNYLLQRLDSFEGIAILTTNFASAIDSAFKRRLSLRLTFPFPDDEQRERLWRAHLPPETPIAGHLDLGEIARRYRLSGGYIRNCALRAAFLAADEGLALTGDHLERAIRAEYREIGKLSEGGVLE